MTTFPARIHVLLASQAPLGLVIRRGPAKHVATMLWDRTRDQFQVGQWMKGRIYERRSDLSPDGQYLIYFAMNGKWQSEAKGAWTAVSRAPYLKALMLYPKGDCWQGGGLWTNQTQYWLNGCYCYEPIGETKTVREDRTFAPQQSVGAECLSVYFPRLHRDGWQLVDTLKISQCDRHDFFERPLTQGWILRKIAHAQINSPQGKGCYWDEHELIHPSSGLEFTCPDWEWADCDGTRLVWATRGKLFAGDLGSEGLQHVQELYDFNEMTFEPIEAPY